MSQRILRAAVAAAIALGSGWACTDVDLAQNDKGDHSPVEDNKLTLSGRFCTTDPADVVFPLKVLFVIDTSQSMNINDPVSKTEADPTKQTGRAKAIRDVVAKFIDLKTKFIPKPCNTGSAGCGKGSTQCAACGAAGKFMCIGPDCCTSTPASCHGVPACDLSRDNAACASVCDVTKPGCRSGEKNCPDCPSPGDQCMGGICGKHRNPGVEFAIMRFGAAKQVLTQNSAGQDGFTSDVKELITSIPQVSNGGSVTDYEGALAMAYKVIDADILATRLKDAAAVSRTRYIIIFLSDGEPYPPINSKDDWKGISCSVQGDLLDVALADPENCQGDPLLASLRSKVQEYNLPNRILRRVKEIVSLKAYWKIRDVQLHTCFLAGENPSWVEDKATYLLKQMAQVGAGTFRNFQNGEDINFLHVGFSMMSRVFDLKSFIVSNVNAKPFRGTILADSDSDGIEDSLEVEAGTSVQAKDTDGDGFSDKLEYFYRSSGWDPLDPTDADCPVLHDADGDGRPDDSDGDGLLDCEERFLGTSRLLFDSDLDGVPDNIEVKFGTNPVSIDTSDDLDFDGMPNGDEIRLHTDPSSDDSSNRSRTSYRYQVQKRGTGIETVGLSCSLGSDCPGKGGCAEGYCRCVTNAECSSARSCKTDKECATSGEQCVSGKCTGKWTCMAPLSELSRPDKVCAARKHITCYDYTVQNIALVTPAGRSPGWNNINLYFSEAPYDNTSEYGSFSMACARVYYDGASGARLPATGLLKIPQGAWKTPKLLNRTYQASATSAAGGRAACGQTAAKAKVYCDQAGDLCVNPGKNRCRVQACVCPDGKVGACTR